MSNACRSNRRAASCPHAVKTSRPQKDSDEARRRDHFHAPCGIFLAGRAVRWAGGRILRRVEGDQVESSRSGDGAINLLGRAGMRGTTTGLEVLD